MLLLNSCNMIISSKDLSFPVAVNIVLLSAIQLETDSFCLLLVHFSSCENLMQLSSLILC